MARINLEEATQETFAELALASKEEWRKLARYLMRRWPPGSAVDEDDVVQELMIAAWSVLSGRTTNAKGDVVECSPCMRFDRTRGKRLTDVMLWNARYYAKRWVQKQGGVVDDHAPRRVAVPIGDAADVVGGASQEPADLARRDVLRCLDEMLSESESILVVAYFFSGETRKEAARYVYDDLKLRRAVGADSVDHARRLIGKALEKIGVAA